MRKDTSASWSDICDRHAWTFVLFIYVCAATIYLLDSTPQRFEQLLTGFADPRAILPAELPHPPAWMRHHFADFAWSLLAAMVVVRCWPVENRLLRFCLLLLAATSWEWGQFAGLVSGYFDVIDLAVGIIAATLVWTLPQRATENEGAAA